MNDTIAIVKIFVDDICHGKVSPSILQKHKIPNDIYSILGGLNQANANKLKSRIFEHIMWNIGYYESLPTGQDIHDLKHRALYALEHPEEFSKVKEFYLPKLIEGVNEAIETIGSISSRTLINCPSISSNEVSLSKEERCFILSYERDWGSVNDFSGSMIDGTDVIFGDDIYEIAKGGSHLENYKRTLSSPDEISIGLDSFYSKHFDTSSPHYFRYITEVPNNTDITRNIGLMPIIVDGQDVFSIEVNMSDYYLDVYLFNHSSKRYLIVDSSKQFLIEDFQDTIFSLLVALGVITCDIYLNESWLFAYSDVLHKDRTGLMFRSLSPSIHCDYSIFTTNVYSVLIPIAQKEDPVNGETRAISIIDNLKLGSAIPQLGFEVFSNLVQNMECHEALRRGIFEVLSGTQYHLEIQPASFSVALESISSLAKKIIGSGQEYLIDNEKWVKEGGVMARFNSLIDELCDKEEITSDEANKLKKKVNSMNNGFNSDKLRALLVHYNYPLCKFDETTLSARNVFLHGSIHPNGLDKSKTESNLFQLSMNLHMLCCSIALLMSGFRGYVINNRKLYGFDKTCKAFVKLKGI